MKVHVIIPSSGKGLRTGSAIPKQYVKISGRELLSYTLQPFQDSDSVSDITIAANAEYFELIRELQDKYALNKIKRIVQGGTERQDSVYNALMATESSKEDLILIHDAARPLLSRNLLETSINEAKKYDDIVVALKVKDTMVRGTFYAEEYLNREELFCVQTPQIFKYSHLKESMERAKRESLCATDESRLLKMAGFKVKIVEGESANFKITTKEDLDLFKILAGRL